MCAGVWVCVRVCSTLTDETSGSAPADRVCLWSVVHFRIIIVNLSEEYMNFSVRALPAGSRYKPGHQPGSPTGRYTAAAQSTGEQRKPVEGKMARQHSDRESGQRHLATK